MKPGVTTSIYKKITRIVWNRTTTNSSISIISTCINSHISGFSMYIQSYLTTNIYTQCSINIYRVFSINIYTVSSINNHTVLGTKSHSVVCIYINITSIHYRINYRISNSTNIALNRIVNCTINICTINICCI